MLDIENEVKEILLNKHTFKYYINNNDCWIPIDVDKNKWGTPMCSVNYKNKIHTRLYSLACAINNKSFNNPSRIKFLCQNRECINPDHITDCLVEFYNYTEKGRVYGRLTILKYNERLSLEKNYAVVDCICECNNQKSIRLASLKQDKTKSCGCLQIENSGAQFITHNKYNTRLYTIYNGMKQRCFNVNSSHYKNYGGRGISICKEWIGDNGFKEFYEWAMNNGYRDELTIERINVNEGYCVENCKWITPSEQYSNKTSTVRVNYLNKEYTLTALLRELNRSNEFTKIRRYLKVHDFTIEEALSVKNERDVSLLKYKKSLIKYDIRGHVVKSVIANALNIKEETFNRYMLKEDFKSLLKELNVEIEAE